MNVRMMIFAGSVLAFGVMATSTQGQESPTGPITEIDGEADYVASLQGCQNVADASERLACFDREVGRIVGAAQSGDVTIVSAEDVRETRRGLFGLTIPKIKLFESNDKGGDEDAETLTSTITSARRFKRNGWIIRIAEGDAVWQINNAPARLRDIEVGASVEFKKASLGTYFIRINGQLGVKGRRIE